MKRLVVSYAEYSENGERCRAKSMGSHISVKSLGNPTICIYFPAKSFFMAVTMKNFTRYPSLGVRLAVKKFFKLCTQDEPYLQPSIFIPFISIFIFFSQRKNTRERNA